MDFTQAQRHEILEELLSEEEGLHQVFQMSLESLMKSEQSLYREENKEDYSNGFRYRKT